MLRYMTNHGKKNVKFYIFFFAFILPEKELGQMCIEDSIFFKDSSECISCIKNLINKVREQRDKRSNCEDHIYSATESRELKAEIAGLLRCAITWLLN